MKISKKTNLLLDIELIQKDLLFPANITLFQEITSTNLYLKSLNISSSETMICLAETQTKGRGRFGRVWHSPFGQNIYLSIKKTLKLPSDTLPCLSLVTALAIRRALQAKFSLDKIQIKWPNDLICQDKKLAGILIEIIDIKPLEIILVVGIGLNVNSLDAHLSFEKRQGTSLSTLLHKKLNRNPIVASIINAIEEDYKKLQEMGFASFYEIWKTCDYLIGKTISLHTNERIKKGIAQGITNKGLLIMLDENGMSHEVSAGEASVQLTH